MLTPFTRHVSRLCADAARQRNTTKVQSRTYQPDTTRLLSYTTGTEDTVGLRQLLNRLLPGDQLWCARCWPLRLTPVDPDSIEGADGWTCGRHDG